MSVVPQDERSAMSLARSSRLWLDHSSCGEAAPAIWIAWLSSEFLFPCTYLPRALGADSWRLTDFDTLFQHRRLDVSAKGCSNSSFDPAHLE